MQNKYLNMVILHISWLQLSGKIFFPENMMLLPDEKWKMVFLKKKIHGNMIFTSNILKIWSFQKGLRRDMKFFYLLERRYFFSRKHGIFSLDENRERGDLSQEIYGNMTFSNWYAPLQKKKIKDDPIPQKYTQRSLAF